MKNQKLFKNLKSILIHSILITGSIAMILPFIWMLSTSLKTATEVLKMPPIWIPTSWKFSNYIEAWNAQPFARYFVNTIFIAVATTIGQLLTSALAAFAFVYFKFPYKNTIFMLFLGTMMIPAQALLVPNYILLSKLHWIDTYLALIVPWLGSVFGIFFLRQFFLTMPKELYEAAIIDGCSKLKFFFKILLPLSIPPLVTIGIFTFLGSWNTFLWPLIVTNSVELRTIQVGLSYFSQAEGTKWELLMAASTFCVLPLIIGYFFAQKQFIQGIARTGMKT